MVSSKQPFFRRRRPADHLPRILKRSSSGYPFRYHTDYDQPDRLQRNGGAIGAGGLGDVAIRYGYQAYKMPYLISTSIVLIIFVQVIQSVGNLLYKKIIIKRRLNLR